MPEANKAAFCMGRQCGKSTLVMNILKSEIRKRMTVTEREKFDFFNKKQELYYERGCVCEVCGVPVPFNGFQLGHRIPQSYLPALGKEIIHHEKNLAVVCGLTCNKKVDIGWKPYAFKILLAEIKEAIEDGI